MESIYDELTLSGQNRYNGIRRKVQFFSTFAGGAIEALRESGFRLCSFEKEPEGLGLAVLGTPRRQCNGNIELFFEQQDRDQCKVLIVPYRQDLPFLAQGRFVAQLGLELSRYCNDPDTLRQAMTVNARTMMGTFLGGKRLPKLYLDSPPDLKPPGTMTFELRGARLVVAMNVLANLGKYRLSDFELDIDAIREDLQVYFYGLEKYLTLLMQNFGAKITIADEESGEPDTSAGISEPNTTGGPSFEPSSPAKISDPLATEHFSEPDNVTGSSESESLTELTVPVDSSKTATVAPPPPLAGAPLPPRYDLPESLPPGNTVRLDQMPPPQF